MPVATPIPPTQDRVPLGSQNRKRQWSLLIAVKCQYVDKDLEMCSQGHLLMSNVKDVEILETEPASEGPRSLSFISFPITPQLELKSGYYISRSRALGSAGPELQPCLSHSLPSWNLDLIICKMRMLRASTFGSLWGIKWDKEQVGTLDELGCQIKQRKYGTSS